MIDRDALVAALVAVLPDATVVTDPDVMEGYRRDRAATVAAGRPCAVVRASSTADVQATLRVADRFAVPVVTRGAGSGLSGGAAAVDGAITLTTDRMRSIEVDAAAMVVVAQPGARNVDVKREAERHGLWYPPDPSSYEISSIGGNVATNAGGLCCVRYGVTGDYVLGLEVVLADGRAVRLGGRTVKDVAGYDLKRLIIGSEGTLGVVTEVTLRLRPPPPPSSTVVATFPDAVHAGRAVARSMARMRPSVLELMDGAAVAAVERVHRMGFDAGVGALLVAQCDVGSSDDRDAGRLLRRRRRPRGGGDRRPRRSRAAPGRPSRGRPLRRAARHRAHRGRRCAHPADGRADRRPSAPSPSAPGPASRSSATPVTGTSTPWSRSTPPTPTPWRAPRSPSMR